MYVKTMQNTPILLMLRLEEDAYNLFTDMAMIMTVIMLKKRMMVQDMCFGWYTEIIPKLAVKCFF